jgi:predicted TIM-barrel fold metal-dependent hydrolase
MNRRQFLLSLGVAGLSGMGYAGYKFWPEQGLINPCLSGLPDDILENPLMQQIWQDIDAKQVWDSHVHLVGTGDSQSNAENSVWFNPNMDSYWHPILKIQKKFYMNGSCAANDSIDQSSVERMAQLTAEMPAGFKLMLFAFDWFHDANGKPNQTQSIFHISNEYAAKIASEYSQYFEWVASIHPYRTDAVEALEQAKAQGARAIKWLPQGMGIDPANAKCDAFYAACARLDIPIICHTGRESAVQGGNQEDANPLKLRRALDAGVRIVLAHCASDGEDIDYDNSNKKIKSFDLFLRLMEAPQYKDLLFGEISAITLLNHAWTIQPLLQRTDLHSRLLNGSDYPLPAILPIVSLKQLVGKNLLDENHVDFLKAIRLYNPILFDFALKRLLRYEGSTFPTSVFETKKFFA